jgi:antitoxin component YwqK of YwqJK toxin-antitoxin module
MKTILTLFFLTFSIIAFGQDPPENFSGQWITKYSNGQVSFKGEYLSGKQTGECIHNFENGKVRLKGFYLDGLKDGEWTAYYDTGEVRFKVKYLKGEQVGDRKYY